MDTENKLPPGFDSPVGLPGEKSWSNWQDRNQEWWERNPMRYDWNDRLNLPEHSKEFYQEIDRRFFSDAEHYMPAKNNPFDQILPYAKLKEWNVLEIGVGNGSHAQLIAPHCKTYIGIDLTEYAARSAQNRFQLFRISGNILQMDAENMIFPDSSFDYIWTWGVIHHSADTGRVLEEMHRVLRLGGLATIMVYHRSFLYEYIVTGFFRGILCGAFLKRSLHELLQIHTDGAIARFYRPDEWKTLIESKGFELQSITIMGQKSEILPFPPGRLKEILFRFIPDYISRFVTNRCRQGSFLITTIQKK